MRSDKQRQACTIVPENDLLSGLQLSLEKEEMRISRRMPNVHLLLRELMNPDTNRCGEHDGLALALAQASCRARRPRIG